MIIILNLVFLDSDLAHPRLVLALVWIYVNCFLPAEDNDDFEAQKLHFL